MPGGRPTKYPKGSALEALSGRILELARQGASLAQIAAKTGIPRTTMLSWAKAHPYFQATLTRAKELEQAWWEDQGQEGLFAGKRFNDQVWRKAVEARFPEECTERRRVKRSGSITYQVVSRRDPGS